MTDFDSYSSIEAGLSDAMGGIGDYLDSVSASVYDNAASTFNDLITTVDGASASFVRDTGSRASSPGGPFHTTTAIGNDIIDQFNAVLGNITVGINRISTTLNTQVGSLIDSILPSLGDTLALVTATAASFSQQLLDTLATTTDFATDFVRELGRPLVANQSGLQDWIRRIFVSDESLRVLQNTIGDLDMFTEMVTAVTGADDPSTMIGRALERAKTQGWPGVVSFFVVWFAFVMTGGLNSALTGRNAEVTHRSMAYWKPERLSPPEAANALRRGDIDLNVYYEYTDRVGLTRKAADELYLLTRSMAPADAILTSWRRGHLSPNEKDAMIEQLGYAGLHKEVMHWATEHTPTPQDLVVWLVREVFDKAEREALSLDKDYPPEADAEFAKIGIIPSFARNYWAAHWRLPSVTEAFEMYHRTTDAPISGVSEPVTSPSGLSTHRVLSKERLAQLLKTADFAPMWREPLTQISYSPLTRVDVRRMHKIGVLDKVGVVRSYLDLGYDVANAERLADFTERLNSDEDKEEKNRQLAPARSEVAQAYNAGTLSEHEARTMLAELDTTPAEIETAIVAIQLDMQRQEKATVISGVQRLYVYGYIAEEGVRQEFIKAGIPVGEAERRLQMWQWERAYRDLTQDEKEQRNFTQAQIIRFYRDRIIDPATAMQMLVDIRYTEQQAILLLNLADVQEKQEDASAIKQVTEARYKSGEITRAQAAVDLDSLGISTAQREALLTKWNTQQEGNRPRLPFGTLERLAEQQLISEDELRAELKRLRYIDADIEKLVRLVNAEEARLELAEERRIQREKVAAQRVLRDLVRQDVEYHYLDELVDYQAAYADLTANGWNPNEAQRILSIAGVRLDRKRAAELEAIEREEAAEARRAEAEARRIRNEQEAEQRRQLAATERAERERVRSAEKAERERLAHLRLIRRQDIEKEYVLGSLSRSAAMAELQQRGYDSAQSERIIRIIELKQAQSAETEAGV